MARAKENSVESMGASPDKVHLARVTVWLTRCACASLAMRLWLLGSVGIGLWGRVGIGLHISLRGEDVQVKEDRGELGGEEVQHEHAAPAVDSAVRPHDEREQVVRPHQTRVGPAHLGGQLVAMLQIGTCDAAAQPRSLAASCAMPCPVCHALRYEVLPHR